LLSIQPERTVQLGALKIAGNPTATGSCAEPDPAAVTLRLVETTGAPTDIAITSPVGTLSDMVSADLLEAPRLTADPPLTLHGYQIATVSARLEATPLIESGGAVLAPDSEAAQPLYARYWLHNRGPAPLGGLPAVAHLHPETVAARPGETVRLRLSIASDCSDTSVSGVVRMRYPHGWSDADDLDIRMWTGGRRKGGELHFELPPRGYRDAEFTVRIPDDATPGQYPVRAELALSGDLPPAWHQPVEDVCVITVGDLGDDDGELVRLITEPQDVVVERGQRARLAVTVGSDAGGDLNLEAHLISPWGTWEWMGPAAAAGAVLPARSTIEVGFDIAPPPWQTPGRWWALIRIGCAGRLLYTSAVSVTVR
jgi:alpha-mannosidase